MRHTGKKRGKVGRFGWKHTDDDGTFHAGAWATELVRIYPDGTVQIFTGGYRTHSTTRHINEHLSPGIRISGQDGEYIIRIEGYPDGIDYDFVEGMKIKDGKVLA